MQHIGSKESINTDGDSFPINVRGQTLFGGPDRSLTKTLVNYIKKTILKLATANVSEHDHFRCNLAIVGLFQGYATDVLGRPLSIPILYGTTGMRTSRY